MCSRWRSRVTWTGPGNRSWYGPYGWPGSGFASRSGCAALDKSSPRPLPARLQYVPSHSGDAPVASQVYSEHKNTKISSAAWNVLALAADQAFLRSTEGELHITLSGHSHPALASRICRTWMALASCPTRQGQQQNTSSSAALGVDTLAAGLPPIGGSADGYLPGLRVVGRLPAAVTGQRTSYPPTVYLCIGALEATVRI